MNTNKTITLYHGTRNDVQTVYADPKACEAANGRGFYMTPELAVASSYGHNVIAVVLYLDDMPDHVVRKLDVPASSSAYALKADLVLEYVISDMGIQQMLTKCDDWYIVEDCPF